MTLIDATSQEIETWLRTPGFGLGPSQFTFSISTSQSLWPSYGAGSEPLDATYAFAEAELADAFRAAIALWDSIIAPDFEEVADNAVSRGEIRVAYTDTDPAFGYAYSGNPTAPGGSVGDIWIDAENRGGGWLPGDHSFEALLHEIGHTLGLKHPFSSPSVPADLDDIRYSVMSYSHPGIFYSFQQVGNSIEARGSGPEALTPMVLDIAAAQAIYGPELNTRTGDDIYVFAPWQAVVSTIYDAGGTDTIDASAIDLPSKIDLRSGAYSSLGLADAQTQIAYWSNQFPDFAGFIASVINGAAELYTFTDNLGIAISTQIENAVGGAGSDLITGNAAANSLVGNGGNDHLIGGEADDMLTGGTGDDILDGGPGSDMAVFAINSDEAQLVQVGADLFLTSAALGSDQLIDIEALSFLDGVRSIASLLDTSAPIAASFSPVSGSSSVAADSDITLVFSEDVQRGTGTVEIRSGSADGPVFESFDVAASSQIDISGPNFIINPASDLAPGTQYFVVLAPGSVEDMAGNDFAGIDTYEFTTAASADTTPPTFVVSLPANGQTEVDVSASIGVGFSEHIQRGAGTVEIRSGSADGPLVEGFDVATSDRILIIGNDLFLDPTADLPEGTDIFVTVPPGAIEDLARNLFAGTAAFSFATADPTPPTIIDVDPGDGSADVGLGSDIAITFSENVQRGEGVIEIRSGSANGPLFESFEVATSPHLSFSGSTLTIDPTSDLAPGTQYFVILATGSVTDLADNEFGGIDVYDFTTEIPPDTTPPVLIDLSPGDGSTNIAVDALFTATFSEEVQRGTGSVEIRSGSFDGPLFESIDVATSGQIDISGPIFIINPLNDLAPATQYWLVFSPGSVEDMAGNVFTGIDTYDFTTALLSNLAPIITSDGGGDEAAMSVNEGTRSVTTLEASDPNDDPLTFAIVGGADAGSFTINPVTGALSFVDAPDFEMPGDVGQDNVYEVVVSVSDGELSDTQSLTVSVVDRSVVSRLILPSGAAAAIGGTTDVILTSGHQDLTVLDEPGTITLVGPPGGDDTLRFGLDAAGYTIVRSGSRVTISDGDTFVIVPASPIGINVEFADKSLMLGLVDGLLKIGSQVIATEAQAITAPSQSGPVADIFDPFAIGRIIVAQGSPVSVGGRVEAFGTSFDRELLKVIFGDISLRSGFTDGGDTILFPDVSIDFDAYRSGSTVVVQGDFGPINISIPVSPAGIELGFPDGSQDLRFDTGKVLIGDQELGTTPARLSPDTLVVGIEQGSPGLPSFVEVGSSPYIVVDRAEIETNVVLTGFSNDDLIRVTGATLSDASFARGDADGDQVEDDLIITITTDAGTETIAIANVLATDALVTDLLSAQNATGLQIMTFA